MENMPVWFDEGYYLKSKLAQLHLTDPDSGWTMQSMQQAFSDSGYDAYRHFQQYGLVELTSPNSYFNAYEYLQAKLAQLQANGFDQYTSIDDVAQAIKHVGLDIWGHFQQFGWKEGINPSNDFDISGYFDAKLKALQLADPDGDWGVDKVMAAFEQAGLDPITHYNAFGQNEGVEPQKVPLDQRVPAAPDREEPKPEPDPYHAPDNGGGSDTLPFSVHIHDGVVTFAGVATGQIEFAIADGQVSFYRGWVGGDQKIPLNNIKTIFLSAPQQLSMTDLTMQELLTVGSGQPARTITGEGRVTIVNQNHTTIDAELIAPSQGVWQIGNVAGDVSGLSKDSSAGFVYTDRQIDPDLGALKPISITAADDSDHILVYLLSLQSDSMYSFAGPRLDTVSITGSVVNGTSSTSAASKAGYKAGLNLAIGATVDTIALRLDELEGTNPGDNRIDLSLSGDGLGNLETLTNIGSAGIWLDALHYRDGRDAEGNSLFVRYQAQDLNNQFSLNELRFAHGDNTVKMALSSLKDEKAGIVFGTGTDNLVVDITNSGFDGATATELYIEGGEGRNHYTFETSDAKKGNITDINHIAQSLITVMNYREGRDCLNLEGITQDKTLYNETTIGPAENLQEAASAAATLARADGWLTFTFNGDDYIFVNDDNAELSNGDTLIKLIADPLS